MDWTGVIIGSALAIILGAFFIIFVCLGGDNKEKRILDASKAADSEDFESSAIEMPLTEFLNIRKGLYPDEISQELSFPGVYVIYNETRNMHYIGQAARVGDRVYSHFTGKGNGDVYADYKYGSVFTLKLIEFSGSGYNTLNQLEKDTIMVYNSYAKGYNKTRGNR